MSREGLNDLVILLTEKNMIDHIDAHTIINDFASKNACMGCFV